MPRAPRPRAGTPRPDGDRPRTRARPRDAGPPRLAAVRRFAGPSRSTPPRSAGSRPFRTEELTIARCPSVRNSTTGTSRDRVEVGRAREVGAVPRRLVEPLEHDEGLPVVQPRADDREEPSFEEDPGRPRCGSERPVPVRWTWLSMNPGTIVVPGRSTRKSASGGRPCPPAGRGARRRGSTPPSVREGDDARGAVEGPHGAAMIEESCEPSAKARSSSRSASRRVLPSCSASPWRAAASSSAASARRTSPRPPHSTRSSTQRR